MENSMKLAARAVGYKGESIDYQIIAWMFLFQNMQPSNKTLLQNFLQDYILQNNSIFSPLSVTNEKPWQSKQFFFNKCFRKFYKNLPPKNIKIINILENKAVSQWSEVKEKLVLY